jgi:hypothetical protein
LAVGDPWGWLRDLLLTSEFAKSPVAGVLVGLALLLIKDFYDRLRARRTLLRALHTECRTTWAVLDDLARKFPKKAEADAIVDAVKYDTLDFDAINGLPSGWALFVPTLPIADVLTKLKPKEAEAAIAYFDGWTRVTDFERRMTTLYGKLVDLTPNVGERAHATQLREIACQLRGSWNQLRIAAEDLAKARLTLEDVIERSLSFNPFVIWRPKAPGRDVATFPADWSAPAS